MKKKLAVLALGGLMGFSVIVSGCAPAIPHVLEGRKDCVSCHAQNGVKPYPKWHFKKQFDNGKCADCHKVKISRDKA